MCATFTIFNPIAPQSRISVSFKYTQIDYSAGVWLSRNLYKYVLAALQKFL